MILVDTSIWIDHLRFSDQRLVLLLNRAAVLVHPLVIGELAMGSLARRDVFLATLGNLPHCTAANDTEVLGFVQRHSLFGLGLGFIDAHLLASATLHSGAKLWTRDRRLKAAAETLGIADAEST